MKISIYSCAVFIAIPFAKSAAKITRKAMKTNRTSLKSSTSIEQDDFWAHPIFPFLFMLFWIGTLCAIFTMHRMWSNANEAVQRLDDAEQVRQLENEAPPPRHEETIALNDEGVGQSTMRQILV